MGKNGKFGSFLLGGLIGAGVALLFAPRAGAETRALVADKVDEMWGEGEKIYAQGRERVAAGVAQAGPLISKKNDELREKIESARASIAEQVAKNAAAAREALGDKIPATADVVRGKLDEAASKLRGVAADIASKDASNAASIVDDVTTSEIPAPESSAADAQ